MSEVEEVWTKACYEKQFAFLSFVNSALSILHVSTVYNKCMSCVCICMSRTHAVPHPHPSRLLHIYAHTPYRLSSPLSLDTVPHSLGLVPTPQAVGNTMPADTPISKLQRIVCQTSSENGRKSFAFRSLVSTPLLPFRDALPPAGSFIHHSRSHHSS